MMTSGPFSMEPNLVYRIVIAFVFAHAIGDPDHLEVYGDPPRPDPNDPVLAEFMGVIQTARYLYPFVGIEDDSMTGNSPLPRSFSLSQNYPNPFNPTTTISFDVAGTSGVKQQVQLTVYNVRGKQIIKLIDSEYEPGSHRVVWDGKNDKGEPVSSGIYLYTLRSGDKSYTKKMVMVK